LHDQLVARDRAGMACRAPRGVHRSRRPAVAEARPSRRRGDARRPAATTGHRPVGWRQTRSRSQQRMTDRTPSRMFNALPLRGLARSLSTALLLLAGCAATPAPDATLAEADTLIFGGLVFDGGEGAGRLADVAIRGERIVDVG